MESIWRRLRYYGIGFGLGTIFVIFFFQNRGCSWLPSNRVKNSILDRLIVVSDETAAILSKKGITADDVVQVLNDGDVVFDKSNKEKYSKIYAINNEGENFFFTLPYESFISEVFIVDELKDAIPSSDGIGSIIRYPDDDNMVFPDSSTFVTCQQELLGLIAPKEIFKLIKETGKIDFSKTDLSIRPKPEHYLFFECKNEQIGATVIWYKSKLNIIRFHIPFENECD